MTSFIDTHCHLDKLESNPEETLEEAKQKGVKKMVTISVDEESFDFVSKAVRQFKNVYGTIGIHPHDASEFSPKLEKTIRKRAREQDKIIAIGEKTIACQCLFINDLECFVE